MSKLPLGQYETTSWWRLCGCLPCATNSRKFLLGIYGLQECIPLEVYPKKPPCWSIYIPTGLSGNFFANGKQPILPMQFFKVNNIMLKVKLYEHGTLSYHAVTNFTCLNTDSRDKGHGIKHFAVTSMILVILCKSEMLKTLLVI